MTDAPTSTKPGPRWGRRAIIAIVVLVFLSPCVAVREKRWELCPICGAYEPSTRVWGLGILRSSSSECIGGEHVWCVSACQTDPFLPWSGMLGNFGIDYGVATKLFLKEWFLADPQGEERQRVRRALQVATREELDEALSNDHITERFEAGLRGEDPGWTEWMTTWADRVLARDREEPPFSSR